MIQLGRGDGPIPARVMIVGEAWGEREEAARKPFVGPSGFELDRMLHEAGILRAECFVTNLVNARPPNNDLGAWIAMKKKDITSKHVPLRDKLVLPIIWEGHKQLISEIEACKPNLIIAFGNAAMWALTEKWGILKWRGSMLKADYGSAWSEALNPPKVIPTIHPASVEWKQRAAVVQDLRRAKRELESRQYNEPNWNFIIRPSIGSVLSVFNLLRNRLEAETEVWIDLDLETRSGHIACCGLSWSKVDALCIPFMCRGNQEGYWSEEEETEIVWGLYELLTHKHAFVRAQNGLYDVQYTHRSWHFIPNIKQDTMISQHALFSDQPKSLAYQASLYCEFYQYWKEDK